MTLSKGRRARKSLFKCDLDKSAVATFLEKLLK